MNGTDLTWVESFMEQIDRSNLSTEQVGVVKDRCTTNEALVEVITGLNLPGHFSVGGELAVDIDLHLGTSPLGNVSYCTVEPFVRCKLVGNAVLEAYAFDFHRGEHQTVSCEVSRITDARLARAEVV